VGVLKHHKLGGRERARLRVRVYGVYIERETHTTIRVKTDKRSGPLN
jgi:hypothetical protein